MAAWGCVVQVGMEIRPDRVFQTWSKATFKSLDNLLLVVCAAAGYRPLRLSAQSKCLRVVLGCMIRRVMLILHFERTWKLNAWMRYGCAVNVRLCSVSQL